jgi:hypothetical protein
MPLGLDRIPAPGGRAKVGRFGVYTSRKSGARRLRSVAYSRVFSTGVDFRGVLITQRSKVQILPPQPSFLSAERELSALLFVDHLEPNLNVSAGGHGAACSFRSSRDARRGQRRCFCPGVETADPCRINGKRAFLPGRPLRRDRPGTLSRRRGRSASRGTCPGSQPS